MKIHGSFDPATTSWVEIAPGLRMPQCGKVTVTDCGGYDLELKVELDNGRYHCRLLQMNSCDGGPEVTGEAVRSVPVASIIGDGVRSIAHVAAVFGGLHPPVNLGEQGPTREALEWVARIYRLAYAVGDTPKKAVESALGLSPATAGRWVAKAREAGYLGAAQVPGKAGV